MWEAVWSWAAIHIVHSEKAMFRRKPPGKKWVAPHGKRLCQLEKNVSFHAQVKDLREKLKIIVADEKEMSRYKRPHRWNGQPIPLTKSVFTLGFKEFSYVLRPQRKPTLVFGTRTPRFEELKKPKLHRLKVKRKGYFIQPDGTIKPQCRITQDQRKPSETVHVDDVGTLSLTKGLRIASFSKRITRGASIRVAKGSVRKTSGSFSSFVQQDIPRDSYDFDTISFDEQRVGAKKTQKRTSGLLKPTTSEEEFMPEEEEELQDKIIKPPPKIYPGPADYTIKQFPEPTKLNKYPFNSTWHKPIEKVAGFPCVASYKIDMGEKIKGVNVQNSLGGPRTVVFPTKIRCVPLSRNLCKRCQSEAPGDFYFSKFYGTLCRICFKNEITSAPHVIESFMRARHCGFMHFHDQHNIVRIKSAKEVLKSLKREAYCAQFPDLTKMVKSIDETVDQVAKWMAMCRKMHKQKKEPLKLHPMDQREFECNDLDILVDEEELSVDDYNDQEEEEEERESADREEEMAAKEFQYLKLKGRNSILPIFEVLFNEELGDGDLSKEASSDSFLTDKQKGLLRKFGSLSSFYGVLIPEYREKGIVHCVDPESDNYILTAKGRSHYLKTPIAWDLSEVEMVHTTDQMNVKVVDKEEITKIVKKKKKRLRSWVNQRKVATPPLPGPRLSEIIKPETIDADKPILLEFELQVPIVSRDYDIPKAFWLSNNLSWVGVWMAEYENMCADQFKDIGISVTYEYDSE